MLSFSASCATIWRIGCDLRTGLVALCSQSVELTLWKKQRQADPGNSSWWGFFGLFMVSDPKKVERYNKMQSLMKITGRRVDLAMKPFESARDRIFCWPSVSLGWNMFKAERLAAFTNPWYRNARSVRTSAPAGHNWVPPRTIGFGSEVQSARTRPQLHASSSELPDKWKATFAFPHCAYASELMQIFGSDAGRTSRGLQRCCPESCLFDEGANIEGSTFSPAHTGKHCRKCMIRFQIHVSISVCV